MAYSLPTLDLNESSHLAAFPMPHNYVLQRSKISPQLIFDHQMCIDVGKQTIYVFGGQILTPRNIDDMPIDPRYSGLFSYHIATNMWTQFFVDCGYPSAAHFDVPSIKSRSTHSDSDDDDGKPLNVLNVLM
ncbi:hypothetical protein DMENIID0001_037850 [Sergentomyia squamirostris]